MLMSRRTCHLDLPGPIRLSSGERLPTVRIAYRTWGDPAPRAVLVCHALTGSADADDWWGGMFGTGRAFDPADEFIVAVNVIGSCYGTTGPTDIPPGSATPYGPTFPKVSIADMVRLQAAVLDHLGVQRVSMVVGGSMGAMQALQWGASFPERVDSLVPIAVGAAQSPWAVAISDAQRAAIHADPDFNGGRYSRERPPTVGLATARMIAMISYRSSAEFAARFGRNQQRGVFDAQAYLRRHGEKLVGRFDANTYLTLIDAMDSFDLTDRVGSIATPTLVAGISSDVLYPPAEVEELASSMPNARFALLTAEQGHDSFLIETDALGRLITSFRQSLSTGPSPSPHRSRPRSRR